jgi:charged multivesicular body protein 7
MVFVPLVEKFSQKLMAIERVNASDFIRTRQECADLLGLSLRDTNLVLSQLHSKNIIKMTFSEKLKDKIVKFNHSVLNQQDEGIAVMKTTLYQLHQQVDFMNKKIQEQDLLFLNIRLQTKAKKAISQGQKVVAMHSLKQKKFLQDLVEKRLQHLETLERIMFKIDHAETEADVIFLFRA